MVTYKVRGQIWVPDVKQSQSKRQILFYVEDLRSTSASVNVSLGAERVPSIGTGESYLAGASCTSWEENESRRGCNRSFVNSMYLLEDKPKCA